MSGPPTARQAAENIIRNWDPDYIVDCRKEDPVGNQLGGSIEGLDPSDLIVGDGFRASKAGVSAALLYQHFHRRVFQFVRSGGPRPILPEGQGSLGDLARACFRHFPSSPMEERYRSALDADKFVISPASLFQMLALPQASEEALIWPLSVGAEGLAIYRGGGGLDEQIFFLLDPASPIDLIDFWNLRASGHRVMPVPIEQAEEIAGFWKNFWATRSTLPIEAVVGGGRRLDGDAIRSLHAALKEAGVRFSSAPGSPLGARRRMERRNDRCWSAANDEIKFRSRVTASASSLSPPSFSTMTCCAARRAGRTRFALEAMGIPIRRRHFIPSLVRWASY